MAANSFEQQALERAARMYGSFDRRQEKHPLPTYDQPGDKPADEPPQKTPEQPPAPKAGEERAAPPKPRGLLDTLLEDQEQSLILLLLVILMKDGAELNAVLALMYLLL